MHIADAVAIVSDLAELNDQPVLEQLMDMQDSLDLYTKEQRVAYRIFMSAGAAMFSSALVDSR